MMVMHALHVSGIKLVPRGKFLEKSCEGFQDLLGGLGPDEGPQVVVPALDPGADVGFEGLNAVVVAAREQVGGHGGQEPLDLVNPRRVGRGQVQERPWVARSSQVVTVGVLWVR